MLREVVGCYVSCGCFLQQLCNSKKCETVLQMCKWRVLSGVANLPSQPVANLRLDLDF